MWVVWSAFVSVILLNNNFCEAVNCTDVEVLRFDKGTVRNTTCEGSVCMNFHYKRTNQVDKTCITTGAFKIPTGCIQFDRLNKDLIACFCDTEYCNSGDSTNPRTVMKESMCAATYAGTPVTHSMATVCSMTVIDEGSNRTITKAAENQHETAFPVPITQSAPLYSFNYYFGIVHTTTGIEKNKTTHYYKCNWDNCNTKDHGQLKSKTDVECQSTDGERCKGEFCVFATNGTVLMYCLSTEKINTTNHYEVGIFKYKEVTFYLCQENFCNSDEETAKKSIVRKNEQADKKGNETTGVNGEEGKGDAGEKGEKGEKGEDATEIKSAGVFDQKSGGNALNFHILAVGVNLLFFFANISY